ncbi:MAG: hypothetical protein AB2L24_15250 [Mangrovibacterium sp.]
MESVIAGYIDLLKNTFSGKEAAYQNPYEQTTTQEGEKTIKEAEKISQQTNKISQEMEKIKSVLPRKFYTIKSETEQRDLIRNLHARLVWVSDRFYEIARQGKSRRQAEHRELLPAQEFILSTLDQLISFIYDHFRWCCNEHQKIAEYLRPAVTGGILEKLEAVNFSPSHPDHHLFKTVKAAICDRFNESHITYRLIDYVQALINEIGQLKKIDPEGSLGITLADVLISFNFNDNILVSSIVCIIKDEVYQNTSVSGKIEKLNYWLKKINQEPFNPAGAFHPEKERVSDYLAKWIGAEIIFYEKGHPPIPGNSGPTNLPVNSSRNRKLKINLSVPQIACLMRILDDCGIIQHSSPRELSGFTAEHFRSKKQENISSESLRVKYYNVEESARERIRQLVVRLLEKVSSPICKKKE